MSKVKSVTVYRDDVGGEHDTAEAAERANELRQAQQQFHNARQAVSRALLNTATTGCGRSFEDVSSGHYWEVRRCVMQRPIKRRVWIWPHDCVVVQGDDSVRYRADVHDGRGGRVERIDVAIGNLYSTYADAQKRYLELFREYAAEVAAELADLDRSYSHE